MAIHIHFDLRTFQKKQIPINTTNSIFAIPKKVRKYTETLKYTNHLRTFYFCIFLKADKQMLHDVLKNSKVRKSSFLQNSKTILRIFLIVQTSIIKGLEALFAFQLKHLEFSNSVIYELFATLASIQAFVTSLKISKYLLQLVVMAI